MKLSTHPVLRAATLLTLVFGVFACGGESSEEPAAQEPTAGQPSDPAVSADTLGAAQVDAGSEALPVTLEAVNESGVEGRATTIQIQDSVQLSLMVQGLPREGEYAAHIHRGTCVTGGAVVLQLNPVRAESDGMGRSLTTIPASRLSREAQTFVQVHGSAGVLACGDVHGG